MVLRVKQPHARSPVKGGFCECGFITKEDREMRRIFVLLLAAIIMLYAVPVYADADVVTFGISCVRNA